MMRVWVGNLPEACSGCGEKLGIGMQVMIILEQSEIVTNDEIDTTLRKVYCPVCSLEKRQKLRKS